LRYDEQGTETFKEHTNSIHRSANKGVPGGKKKIEVALHTSVKLQRRKYQKK
jgi:hypothetical protein